MPIETDFVCLAIAGLTVLAAAVVFAYVLLIELDYLLASLKSVDRRPRTSWYVTRVLLALPWPGRDVSDWEFLYEGRDEGYSPSAALRLAGKIRRIARWALPIALLSFGLLILRGR